MKNFCTLICLISLNILCHSVPQFNNFKRGAIKTTAQLKKICETQFEFSRWIDDRCYFFHNKEVQSFDDSQKICSDAFKKHGFDNGRVYEPRGSGYVDYIENFIKVYEMAEEFSKRPTLQLWIGLNDKEKDGQFVYNSNGRLPRHTSWEYDSQPNGGLAENCVTAFKENQDDYSPSWYDRPCIENDSFGDVGHKFMCECDVPDQNKSRNPQPYQGFVKVCSGSLHGCCCSDGKFPDPISDQCANGFLECAEAGGVAGRRRCVGQLSLFRGRRLLEKIDFVEPIDKESLTLAANENGNNFRIDSIEATGDCCWEIESNDGDYETVDPKNPADINIFYIHKIIVFNSCPN